MFRRVLSSLLLTKGVCRYHEFRVFHTLLFQLQEDCHVKSYYSSLVYDKKVWNANSLFYFIFTTQG